MSGLGGSDVCRDPLFTSALVGSTGRPFALCLLGLMASPVVDDGESAVPSDSDPDKKKKISSTLKEFDPMYLGGQVSVGALLGYCAGVCVKGTAHIAAYGVGGVFIIVQYLAYKGVITINWNKALSEVGRALDRDGDGKFDMNDLKIWWKDLLTILTWNLPGGSGFLGGFYYALT